MNHTRRPQTLQPEPATRKLKSENFSKAESRKPKPETRNPKAGSPNFKPESRKPKPQIRKLKAGSPNPAPQTRKPEAQTENQKPPEAQTPSPKPETEGLDEISPSGPTHVWLLQDGKVGIPHFSPVLEHSRSINFESPDPPTSRLTKQTHTRKENETNPPTNQPTKQTNKQTNN